MEKKPIAKRARRKTKINSLPSDLFIEVLVRLPFKSLSRFLCVSKEWYALIFSPSFKNLCMKNGKTFPYFCLLWRRILDPETNMQSIRVQVIDLDVDGMAKKTPQKFFLDFTFDTTVAKNVVTESGIEFDMVVKGVLMYYATSCHGLVCIASKYSKEQVYVTNPIWNAVLRLPPPYWPYVDLDYGTRICIGFLPSRNQYKIVSWHDSLPKKYSNPRSHFRWKMDCEILTLTDSNARSGSSSSLTWRKANTYSYPGGWFEMPNTSICVNGVMYWLISNYKNRETWDIKILALDMETEEFVTVCLPFDIPATRYFDGCWKILISFKELRGCLCLYTGRNVMFLHKDESESGPKYHWDPKITISFDEFNAPLRKLRQAAKECVHLWNAESDKSHYLFVHKKNKKPIKRYGDGYGTNNDNGSNLLIVKSDDHRQILFQGSLFSLNKSKGCMS